MLGSQACQGRRHVGAAREFIAASGFESKRLEPKSLIAGVASISAIFVDCLLPQAGLPAGFAAFRGRAKSGEVSSGLLICDFPGLFVQYW